MASSGARFNLYTIILLIKCDRRFKVSDDVWKITEKSMCVKINIQVKNYRPDIIKYCHQKKIKIVNESAMIVSGRRSMTDRESRLLKISSGNFLE